MLLRNAREIDGDHDDGTTTVAYSGPRLAELLAASGESAALCEVEIDVEPPTVREGRRFGRTTTPEPSADDVERPRPTGSHAATAAIAVVGVLFGVLVSTWLSAEGRHASHALARPAEKRELVTETASLVSPTLQKVATKKRARVPASASRGIPAGIVAASRPRETADDPRTPEDIQLLLAARQEQGL